MGGHGPCALKALSNDSATLVRPDNREHAPSVGRHGPCALKALSNDSATLVDRAPSTDQPAFLSDASRIRLTIASACACWRALGSPTSAASSSM